MSRFPLSGELSMNTIATALGVPTNAPYSMSDFVGKTLYNTDGSTYTVPALPFTAPGGIYWFYGRYYTNPYVPPVTLDYFPPTGIITPPSGYPTPVSFALTLWGAGGGGGGGGGGWASIVNVGGGGGGGGAGGGNIVLSNIAYIPSEQITVSIGIAGTAGGGSQGTDGFVGGNGGNTTLIYNNNTYTATGGAGGGGGNWGHNEPGIGQGGYGGGGGSPNGNGGQNGGNGDQTSAFSTANGGYFGRAGGGRPGGGWGGGGSGGEGGSASPGPSSTNGASGNPGGDGVVTITWYFV